MTQDQALNILKSGANVFLTGEPGSGKTHTVNEYVRYLRSYKIEPAITASTGIAATHLGGMTIHSWSGIGIKDKLSKSDINDIVSSKYITDRIEDARVLVIDEVSMLSATTLTMVDMVCRAIKNKEKPFGGMQIVLVGDFFQLPPIVRKDESMNRQTTFLGDEEESPFAYASPAWEKAELTTCYLDEQYRQDDPVFLSLLSAIRRNNFDENHFKHIKERKVTRDMLSDGMTKLFSHNADVDRINDMMLGNLTDNNHTFTMGSRGHKSLVASMKKGCLSPEILHLKKGAVVMFTKNNPREGFANGTLGVVASFNEENGHPVVKTKNGRHILVKPMDWTIEVGGEARARLTQLPLRLAWAITVHKSQGMSLDEAVMDLSGVFEFGQGYVALSRVRRLSGVHLLGWNEMAFRVSPDVLTQDNSFRQASFEVERRYSLVNQTELVKTHENFIIACGGHITPLAENNQHSLKVKKKKTDTYQETLKLWLEGKNIIEIAKVRSLHERTILDHIEHLVEGEKILLADVFARLVSDSLAKNISQIQATFRELDTMRLSPVFEKFNGKYSYEELRIARMLIGEERKAITDKKVDLDEMREKHPSAYLPWDEAQDEKLTKLFREGKSTVNLATMFERTKGSIRSRLVKLGLVDKIYRN